MRVDILDLVWRLFSSRGVTIALLVVVILVLAGGAVLPQMPDDLVAGSPEHARWLASIQTRYLQWSDRLGSAGLLSVRDSLWLRLPLALLLVNLVVCATQQSATLLRERKLSPQEFGRTFPPECESFSFLFAGDPSSALNRSRQLLEGRGYKVRTEEVNGGLQLAALRFHSARWGVVLAHGGLILATLGVVVGVRLGWQERGIALGPGQEYQVQHSESTSLRLEDFTAELYPDGKPESYEAEVTLLENGTVATMGTLTPGAPLWHRGMLVHQVAHGPLVSIRAVDAQGLPITLQTLAPSSMAVEEASLQLSEDQREGYIAVPERNLVLRAASSPEPTSRAEDSPGLLLQAYRGGTADLVFSETLHKSATVDIEGDSYTVRWGQYAILDVTADPVFPLVMVGAVGLLVGTTITLCLRPCYVWAAMTGKHGVVEARLLYRGYGSEASAARESGTLMPQLEEVCRGR
jgi:cytochrome c biogenesis protein ResB